MEEINNSLKNKFTIVILTYNRINCALFHVDLYKKNLSNYSKLIVVDNCSDYNILEIIEEDEDISIIVNDANLGAVGRNSGISASKADYIVTLDDDVYGLDKNDLLTIEKIFLEDATVAAINFKIKYSLDGSVIDWCHPRDKDIYSNCKFETNDISEGAVVFRKKALDKVGLYPESFFISHEGPDLAFRLINNGYKVVYAPEIMVKHSCDDRARHSWRRYYYDTRNLLWFVVRNLSFFYGVKRLFIGWGAMFCYALRDGYIIYWLKGVIDSLKGLNQAFNQRNPPTLTARKRWKQIELLKPSFFSMLRKRIKGRGVRI